MMALTEQQYKEFQQVVDWQTGMALPDGRILGSVEKRNCHVPVPDYRVMAVLERFQARDKTILELGPCEGYFTVQLAQICKHLTSLEIRPKNIACTLLRLFLHEIKNVDLKLKDVRDLDDSIGRFDILYHAGVFYHLHNPIEHIFKIRNIADKMLLDTHYHIPGDTRFPASRIYHNGKIYPTYDWTEDTTDIWSGVDRVSRLLDLETLFDLLRDAGFDSIEVLSNAPLPFTPRVVLLVQRTKMNADLPAPPDNSQQLLKAQVKLLENELINVHKELTRLRQYEGEVRRRTLRNAAYWVWRKTAGALKSVFSFL